MPHLLLGDDQQGLAPVLDHGALAPVDLVRVERIGRIEILDHEPMLDLGPDMQQHDQVVVPGGVRQLPQDARLRQIRVGFQVHSTAPRRR
jgi:hypothetical protein